MEVLGQIGDTIYVADPERDVLFTASGDTIDTVVPSPEQFLKFSGAYLQPVDDPGDVIDRVERWATQAAAPLPRRGDPPPADARAYVVGHVASTDEPVLSLQAVAATENSLVWLLSDPETVTTMGDLEGQWEVDWEDQPAPHAANA